jgi:hypothetical protein
MNIDKKTGIKIVVFSTLLLVIGLSLTIHSQLSDYKKIVRNEIQKKDLISPYKGKRTAIYLISEVNKACRSLLLWEKIKNNKNVNIIFWLSRDFTDIDIENFKIAFELSPMVSVKRMNNPWFNIYKQCKVKNGVQHNVLLLINSDGTISDIRRY